MIIQTISYENFYHQISASRRYDEVYGIPQQRRSRVIQTYKRRRDSH